MTPLTANPVYEERVSSSRTQALFSGLTILFFVLLVWRVSMVSLDAVSVVFFCISIFFLFNSLNYKTLVIRITSEALKLKFGIFAWTIPLDNVEACRLDDPPLLMRYGGAGIHFMFVRKRYRVSFNFLEYPRVVIALRRRVAIVRDVSFSTRRPNDVIRLLQAAVSARHAD